MENKLLSPHNSGFHSGDGTVSQLLSITHKLTEALDNGKDVRFFLLSKAFDNVWHKGVLFKLKRKGISAKLLISGSHHIFISEYNALCLMVTIRRPSLWTLVYHRDLF